MARNLQRRLLILDYEVVLEVIVQYMYLFSFLQNRQYSVDL